MLVFQRWIDLLTLQNICWCHIPIQQRPPQNALRV